MAHECWTRRAYFVSLRGRRCLASPLPERTRISCTRGITLVEMMVTLSIIAVLTGILLTGISRTFAVARATSCLSNQRQLGQALMLFYHQNMCLPSDSANWSLSKSLAPYLTDPGVFKCPSDGEAGSADSYQPYYVRHYPTDGTRWFTLGCPRHAGQCVTLFLNGGARISALGKVVADGSRVRQGAPADERTFRNGDLEFEDGSRVFIGRSEFGKLEEGGAGKPDAGKGGGGGGPGKNALCVTVIASFRTGEGTLYSVIRTAGDGEIAVSVNSGSKFDVVTPSGIVSARGTRFAVTTTAGGTQTSVRALEGDVWLVDRATGGIQVLRGGVAGCDSGSATNGDPDCIHCPVHCKNGKHCRNCPCEPKHDQGQGGS